MTVSKVKAEEGHVELLDDRCIESLVVEVRLYTPLSGACGASGPATPDFNQTACLPAFENDALCLRGGSWTTTPQGGQSFADLTAVSSCLGRWLTGKRPMQASRGDATWGVVARSGRVG